MLNKINQELNEALQFEINNRFRTSSSSETIPNTNLSTPIKQQQLQDQLNVSNLIKQINNLIEQLNLIGIAHNQQIQFTKWFCGCLITINHNDMYPPLKTPKPLPPDQFVNHCYKKL